MTNTTLKGRIFKRFRSFFWLSSELLKRHYKVVAVSFIVALFIVINFSRLSRGMQNVSGIHPQRIGVVGAYTPTTLPLFIQELVSSGLTEVDETGVIKPSLALDWKVSEDGKEYTFNLDPNTHWHDGRKFTALDVNYNLKDVQFIAENETTLKVKLKDAFAPLPSFLTKPLFKKGLVGVGLYHVESVALKGDDITSLVLTSQHPDLDPLDFRFYPSESQIKTAFKLGEIDFIEELEDVSEFTNWPTATISEHTKYGQYVAVFFNVEHDFLKERGVRQGLAYALTKPEMGRTTTPLSSQSWAYTTKVKPYEKDLVSAKKLLNPVASESAMITLSTFQPLFDEAQAIAKEWEEVGIRTEVKVETGVPSDFQALLAVQEIPIDPDQYQFWHSTQEQSNITNYASPKIDKLLEDGRKEGDIEKRKDLYADFQLYLVEDVPAIFLYHPTVYSVARK